MPKYFHFLPTTCHTDIPTAKFPQKCLANYNSIRRLFSKQAEIKLTRTVLTRRVSSYGLPAALSDYGVNAAGIAEMVVIFRNDSSLAEMFGSFA